MLSLVSVEFLDKMEETLYEETVVVDRNLWNQGKHATMRKKNKKPFCATGP